MRRATAACPSGSVEVGILPGAFVFASQIGPVEDLVDRARLKFHAFLVLCKEEGASRALTFLCGDVKHHSSSTPANTPSTLPVPVGLCSANGSAAALDSHRSDSIIVAKADEVVVAAGERPALTIELGSLAHSDAGSALDFN